MSFHYGRRQTQEHFNPEGIHINLYKIGKRIFLASLIIYVLEYFHSRVVFQNVLTYLISSLFTICQAQSHNAL